MRERAFPLPRPLVLVASVVALAAATLGATATPAGANRIERHVTVDRLDRRYVAYLPDGYQSRGPLPVVLAFHGGYMDPEGFEDLTRLQNAREARNFIIVFPEGYQRSWNAAGLCCGPAVRAGIDELKFVRALLADLNTVAPVDRHRVYATGYSNGANLSYHFACVAANEFAAIAPVSGAMRDPPGQCHPARAVPVFDWHGLQDRASPFAGGVSGARNAPPDPAVMDTIAFWARVDGTGKTEKVALFGGVADCDIHSEGRDGTRVQLCRLPGMGHRWPGAQPTANSLRGDMFVRGFVGDLGPYSPAIDANDAMLEFFSQYVVPR